MRLTRTDPAQDTLNHAISYLGALADQGQQTIPVRKAMELLGVVWRDPPEAHMAPPPDADPMTGCKPVTPGG